MITEFIMTATQTVFTVLFSVFPNLPPMPQLIVDGWDWFINLLNSANSLLAYFLSTPLYYMAIGLIVFMTVFHYVYHLFVRFVLFRVFMLFAKR